jgi:hypothetical protein
MKPSEKPSELPPSLRIEDAINTACPWSGKPIRDDSLTTYRGAVVGFCNPGCRDKFAARSLRSKRSWPNNLGLSRAAKPGRLAPEGAFCR